MIGRVQTRGDFAALTRARARAEADGLRVHHIPADEAADQDGLAGRGVARVAYAVPARVGTAVVRNRVRRRLRAVVRELDGSRALPAGLYLIGVRRSATGAGYAELRDTLAFLVARATSQSRARSGTGS